MHVSFRLLSAMILGLFLVGGTVAQEVGKGAGSHFYIDQTHPSAADDNPGTEDEPLKTFNGAFATLAGRVVPGDTIWIKNGDYRGTKIRLDSSPRPDTIVFPSGESYSRMIAIQAYPGHRPVINQSVEITDWTPFRGAIWTAPFEEDTSKQFPIPFVDGKPLQQIGGTVRRNPEYWKGKKGESLEDLEPGSFYFDEEAKRLHVWLEDGSNPNERLMSTYAPGQFGVGPGLKYIRISGLTIRYGGIGMQGSYSILEDIDQAWASFSGGFVAGEYNTVIRCRFNHNGNNGMGGRGRGHRILDCETNYNNWRLWSTGWHAGGIKFIPYWHDIVLKGHHAAYNFGDGIWFDARMSNVTIEGCRSYRNAGAGIHFEIGTRAVIKNNIIYENGHRGIYLSNASYCAVLNNVLYRNGMSGIAAIGVERGGGVYGRGEGRYTPAGHNVIWGNILVDNCWDASRDLEKFPTWGNRPELILPSDREANEGNVSDYNVFHRTGERGEQLEERLLFGRNWNAAYATGLADWREKTGWDRNSVVADPMFVNAAEHDFRLAKGSPALWMMKELDDSMRFDFDGKERSSLIQSAGPFEGDETELAKIHQNPPAGKFRLFPLKFRSGQALGESINLARYARAILMAEHAAEIGFGLVGVRVLDIPFLRGSSDYIVLDSACREATMTLGGEVRVLHFLFSAEKVKPGVPAVEAWISRADGQTLRVEWSLDEAGDWTAQPTKLTSTRLGHTGIAARIPKDPPGASVFVTTWTNENEWLPVEKVEFKLLDPEAQVFFLGVSGENTAK